MCRVPLTVLISLMLAIPGLASEPPKQEPSGAVGEQFSVYHDRLLNAASNTLTSMKPDSPRLSNTPPELNARGTDPILEESQLRRFAEQYWSGRIDDLREALVRLNQYRPSLEPILLVEGVPADLVAVVLIESAARPAAQSPRGARGLWQFVPTTARRYGLSITPYTDERLDIEKSTHAAARFLRDLYDRFGDWSLALAAYNGGEQAVRRAMERVGTQDFSTISSKNLLPAETRNYVPAVRAAMKLLGSR